MTHNGDYPVDAEWKEYNHSGEMAGHGNGYRNESQTQIMDPPRHVISNDT